MSFSLHGESVGKPLVGSEVKKRKLIVTLLSTLPRGVVKILGK